MMISNATLLHPHSAKSPKDIFRLLILISSFLSFNQLLAQSTCNTDLRITLCEAYSDVIVDRQITTDVSSNNMPVTSWSGLTIYINAIITINSAFDILDCNLSFGQYGKIVVTDNKLVCKKSRLFSCSSTGWRGIRIESTGRIDFQSNTVEDASIALDIANSNLMLIYYNDFNRNNIDIQVKNVVSNALILGNTFECSSNTYLGYLSTYGIYLANATLTVGLQGTNIKAHKNTFIKHYNHIIASGSILTVYFAEFDCARESAISGYQSTINVLGAASGLFRNLFSDNNIDIYTTLCNLTIENSDLLNFNKKSIYSQSNVLKQSIKIRNNRFSIRDNFPSEPFIKTGIELYRSSGGTYTGFDFTNIIENNWFTINDFTSSIGYPKTRKAIVVYGKPGTHDYMRISGNVIDFGPGGSTSPDAYSDPTITSKMIDVTVGEAGGYQILNNFIATHNFALDNTKNRWGFHLHDWKSPSTNNILRGNAVYGGAGANFDIGMCAFHFDESGPWTICFNQSDYTLRGFHLFNTCSTSDFSYNILGHHNGGSTAALLMEAGSSLGYQDCRHNQWTIGDYLPDFGAKNLGTYSNSVFQYGINETNSSPNPVYPIIGWFKPVLCTDTTASPCHQGLPLSDSINPINQRIINNNQIYDTASTPLDWEAKRNIVAQILRYPGLKTTYPAANTFFNQFDNESEGLYASFDACLDNTMTIPNTLEALLDSFSNELNFAFIQSDSLESTQQDSLDLVNVSSGFQSNRLLILQKLDSLKNEKEQVEASILTTRNSDIASCISLFNALPGRTLYERNQKFIRYIQLKNVSGDTLTGSDIERLHYISLLCPEIAGTTQNVAKTLLPSDDIFANNWPDRPLEGYCDNGDRTSFSTNKLRSSIIYPNPTSDRFKIIFHEIFNGTVQIFDLASRPVSPVSHLADQTEYDFTTSNLPAGLYILIITDNFGLKITNRLVVIK